MMVEKQANNKTMENGFFVLLVSLLLRQLHVAIDSVNEFACCLHVLRVKLGHTRELFLLSWTLKRDAKVHKLQ
jgi:hypothetical protein